MNETSSGALRRLVAVFYHKQPAINSATHLHEYNAKVQVIFRTLALDGNIQRWNADVAIRREPAQQFCAIPHLHYEIRPTQAF
jgi:hypothetical protein